MLIDEKRYCNFCHGVILFGQKHIQVRMAGSDGKSRFEYIHYHYRFKGDCWDRQQHRHASQRTPEQPSAPGPFLP